MTARIRILSLVALVAALVAMVNTARASENWRYGDLTNVHSVTFEDGSTAIDAILTLDNGSSIPVTFGNVSEMDLCYGSMRGNACSVAYVYFEDESGKISDSDGNGYYKFNRVHFMGYAQYLPVVAN